MMKKTYRRTRRTSCLQSPFGMWLKGLAAAIGVTVVLILLFALIVGLTNASDGVIRVGNQLIKIASVLLGVTIAVEKGSDRGAMRGGLLGAVYMGAGVGVYVLCTGQQLSFTAYLMDVLMGVSVGGLYGMLRGNQTLTNKATL